MLNQFSTEDLLERVQASPDELAEELYRIHAAEIDGTHNPCACQDLNTPM